MIRFSRRSSAPAGVQFCDSCAEVSSASQRAQRRLDRVRDRAIAAAWLR